MWCFSVAKSAKSKAVYLSLLLLFGFLLAQPQQPEEVQFTEVKLTLQDLGFNKDILLKGAVGAYSFYIPVLEEFVEGEFSFHLRISPAAPKEGRIGLWLNDLPAGSYIISETGYSPTLKLNLKPAGNKKYIKVTVTFHLFKPETICEALNTADIYAVISKDSFLRLTVRKIEEKTILSYLLDYQGKFSLKTSNPYYLAELSYKLGTLYRKIGIFSLDLREGKPIEVADKGSSYVSKKGLVLSSDDLEMFEKLFILETPNLISFSKPPLPPKPDIKKLIPLSVFGFSTATYTGIGEIIYSIPFNTVSFGGKPRKALLFLRFSVEEPVLPLGDRVSLNIFINNRLIWSRQIRTFGTVQENLIDIPDYALNYGENILNVVFSYYPGTDTCKGVVPPLRVTLFESSGFSISKLENWPFSVKDFIFSSKGPVGLFIEGPSKDFIQEFFRQLGFLNPFISRFEPMQSSAEPLSSVDRYIIILPYEKLSFPKLPLRYDKTGFEIFNPLTNKVVLKAEGKYEFLILETGEFADKPALFVSFTSERAQHFIEKLSREDWGKLTGNLSIISPWRLYVLEMGKKFRIKYKTKTVIELYLKRYKLLFYIIAFAFLTFILILLWRKLT